MAHAESDPIAVVGISCQLPGGADSPNKLWELLRDGVESWSPVPQDRYNEDAFLHPSADNPNGTNNHRGGHFIKRDLRDFDHTFFRSTPQQAAAMDPQQRMLLELTYEAIENAGWTKSAIAGSQTGVYTAIFTTDYDRNTYKDPLDLPVYHSTGTEEAIVSNRISHFFDLRGPSFTLDTACSGGLVALHQACQSLHCHETEAAIVASTSLILSPDHHIAMSNLHMLGDTGRCYPFDVRGEGYGRGEGLVVLAVKRLSDAIRDRDPVRAIIRGTAINQDGYTASGITHPNGEAQADLIRSAYQRAGLKPQDITYVEAHGTGTVAGDREELSALSDVFTGPSRSLPLYVGSMKGNVGHTECTSGLASLIKAMLILKHRSIPPVAGFQKPKPGLPLDDICIPTSLTQLPLDENSTPRVSVNSFGFGGANAHAIIEHAGVPTNRNRNNTPSSPHLFVLSAHNRSSLANLIQSYSEWLEKESDLSLADLSYTLCQRRSTFPWRFSCVAEDRSSLIGKLSKALGDVKGITASPKTELVFIFTGQGAQWAGMGRELLSEAVPSPIFRDSIRQSRDILHQLGATWDLEHELLNSDLDSPAINTAEIAQPATTAVQIALVTLLRAQGIRPRTVVGHSSGEIAAAYTAGYLTKYTALRIAFHRGFMAASSKQKGLPPGAMMAVALGEQEASPYVQGLANGVATIACVNSPNSVTLSGDSEAIEEIADRLSTREDGTYYRRLLVDTAYHSHHMQAVADEYRERLAGLEVSTPETSGNDVTFISSVSGTPKSSGFGIEYWTTNLVSPVRFSDALSTLSRTHETSKQAFFVEIGPHPALSGPVRQCLADPSSPNFGYDYCPTLQRKVDAVSGMLSLCGRLFERAVKLDVDQVSLLSAGSQDAVVQEDLPTYPWDHSVKHWHEPRLSHEYRMRKEPYHDLLGVRSSDSTSVEPRWRHMVSLATLPWVGDHIVDGLIIFPGTGYMCMAIEAVLQLHRERQQGKALEAVAMHKVAFLRALVVPDAQQRIELQLSLKPHAGAAFKYDFSITALSDGTWHEHCSGVVEGLLVSTTSENMQKTTSHLPNLGDDLVSLTSDEIYDELSKAGNTYGPMFQGLQNLQIMSDASQAIAIAETPDIKTVMPANCQQPHLIHPTTLDIFFHTCLPMISRHLGASGSVMPVLVENLVLSTNQGALQSPVSNLEVLTKVTSSAFRTAYAKLSANIGENLVLSASGVEMRSLASHSDSADGAGEKGAICYELDMQPNTDDLKTGGQLPTHVRLLTHSNTAAVKPWVAMTENFLRSHGVQVTRSALATFDIENGDSSELVHDDTCTLVMEDCSTPILSDQSCFGAAFSLFQQTAPLLWLSPDAPSSMHQIVGVARVAHAENDDLRLTTLHVANNVLSKIESCNDTPLFETLKGCLIRLCNREEAHAEREYQITEDSTVLVPRLRRSDPLNRAVASGNDQRIEFQEARFPDILRPLILSSDSSDGGNVNPVFINETLGELSVSDKTSIQLETRAFVLDGDFDTSQQLGQYSGDVLNIGGAVDRFGVSDRVVAFAPKFGASHPQVHQAYASRFPETMTYSLAAALFVPSIAASYALKKLVGLNQSSTILVHSALTASGRAVVAAALSMGASVKVTATDTAETHQVTEQLGLTSESVILTRPSLSNRPLADDFPNGIDAIVHTGTGVDTIPEEVWSCLKPFGHVIVLQSSASLASTSKLPRNSVVQFCNMAEILSTHPSMVEGLETTISATLDRISTIGLHIPTRDVSEIAQANRQVKTVVSSRVVIKAEPTSLVHVSKHNEHVNMREDASYVIAGGLGDLGRRLLLLMARQGAKHLVTLSRRDVDEKDYKALQAQIEEAHAGCRLYCLKCDLTSGQSTRDAAAELIRAGAPPVKGIIQSSAVLQDRTIASMTFEDFEYASRVKVEGTTTLEQAFAAEQLDFFLMLSSAANILGTGGQANYNAGNAVQDAIAQAKRSGFMSLNIGWVADAGHIASKTAREQGLRRAGLRPVLPDEIMNYFEHSLQTVLKGQNVPAQVVIGFDSKSLSQATTRNGNIRSAMFSDIYESPALPDTSSDDDALVQDTSALTKESVIDNTADGIKQQLASLITIDADRIDANHGSILDLGLDSLVSIELRNWVMREFDASLQSSEITTDQSIHDLATKVVSRSNKLLSTFGSETASEVEDDYDEQQRRGDGSITPSSSVASAPLKVDAILPSLPLPQLSETLAMFEQSRMAIDSVDAQRATSEAVSEFLKASGPELQQYLEAATPIEIAEAYERQVYLDRREPLQDYSEYFTGHPIDAPPHSQITRATIVTVAAIDFARRLAAGEIAQDAIHDMPLATDGREWLFYATRRPDVGQDHMEKASPNETVVILRRGHIFQLQLPDPELPLDFSSVYAAYDSILDASSEWTHSVCSLTADDRDSWAKLRKELELDVRNLESLEAIDSAAFVICLDDESPNTPGERHMQFLLNGKTRPFGNRWLDKPLQFAVTENGMSAMIGEHAKIDALDVRQLHTSVCHAILEYSDNSHVSELAYPVKKLTLVPTAAVVDRIEIIKELGATYGHLDHRYIESQEIGVLSLRARRAPAHATVHLAVLLAVYLADGAFRPAWEIASLGTFAHGRLDWVQSVSPSVRAFVEAAAANDDGMEHSQRVRTLFDEAVSSHTRAMTASSRGRGYVNHLYALQGAALARDSDNLPDLFRTSAWQATRRGGPGQNLKVGFMPEDDNSRFWDEGSFLMEGEHGLYAHCSVRQHSTTFAISGRTEYAARICESLERAVSFIHKLLERTDPLSTAAQNGNRGPGLSNNGDWKPDIDVISTAQLIEMSAKPQQQVDSHHMVELELLGMCYIRDALSKLEKSYNTSAERPPHVEKYMQWMTHQIELFNQKEALLYDQTWTEVVADSSGALQKSLEERVAKGSIDGLATVRVGPRIVDILNNETSVLSLLMEDNVLQRIYNEGIGPDVLTQYLKKYLELASFQNPGLDILEIGAGTGGTTAIALNALSKGGSKAGDANLNSYTFTDISPGFFVKAKERFKNWKDTMQFKVLNVEKEPASQGFTDKRYDIVIATNVLHATSCLEETLANVSKCLKPGGKLILIELTTLLIRNSIIFGLFPGWWRSQEEWRKWGPIASESRWRSLLVDAGFVDGLEHIIPDFDGPHHQMSLVIATHGGSGTQ